MINQLKAKSTCIADSNMVGTFMQDLRSPCIWCVDVDSTELCCGAQGLLICQERGGTANTLRAWGLQKNPPCSHTLCTSVNIWINPHVNMPKKRDSFRSWAKPQHSSARYFSPEAPALLATCIHLPVPLCSLDEEKGFFLGSCDEQQCKNPRKRDRQTVAS